MELDHPESYPTLGELIEAIAQQIHYYNNQRIHPALKCPPAVFSQIYRVGQFTKVEINTQLIFNQAITETQSV